MTHVLRECTESDLGTLREISYSTYYETFRHLNDPANMRAYLEQAFAVDKLRNELLNGGSDFYFLYTGEELSGYLKLNEGAAQTDIFDPEALEIERIYIVKEQQGTGLGRILMDEAINIATSRGKKYLWLGVWEKNPRALEFYKQYGFYRVGSHSFFMGHEEQTDYIMRKDL